MKINSKHDPYELHKVSHCQLEFNTNHAMYLTTAAYPCNFATDEATAIECQAETSWS